MQRKSLLLALVVLLVALLPSAEWAQNYNASISGAVTDPTGGAIPKAKVTLTSMASGAVAETTSGPDGYFHPKPDAGHVQPEGICHRFH